MPSVYFSEEEWEETPEKIRGILQSIRDAALPSETETTFDEASTYSVEFEKAVENIFGDTANLSDEEKIERRRVLIDKWFDDNPAPSNIRKLQQAAKKNGNMFGDSPKERQESIDFLDNFSKGLTFEEMTKIFKDNGLSINKEITKEEFLRRTKRDK